jgi:hypothetical protein
MGPPDNELPGTISFHAVLARTDDLALAVVGADAYSSGVLISIAVRFRHSDPFGDDLAHELYGQHRRGAGSTQLLVGIAYPDGRTATNVSAPRDRDLFGQSDQPEQPTLVQRGGGGGGREFGINLWLAPLPPPGDLTVVVAWPRRGIPETHTTIAADLIAAGAAKSVELWPWEPPAPDGEPAAVEPPELPEGGWFAQHTPDVNDAR